MSKKAVVEEKKMKKTDAFRLVVGEFGIDADVEIIVATMKDRYGMEIDRNMASTYRSNERKRLAELAGTGAEAKPVRKAGRPVKEKEAAPVGGSGDVIDFMTDIREWENKLSPHMIQKLVKVLYPS